MKVHFKVFNLFCFLKSFNFRSFSLLVKLHVWNVLFFIFLQFSIFQDLINFAIVFSIMIVIFSKQKRRKLILIENRKTKHFQGLRSLGEIANRKRQNENWTIKEFEHMQKLNEKLHEIAPLRWMLVAPPDRNRKYWGG